MSIKDSHELPDQVFGGVGIGDAIDEVGSKSRGVKLNDISCSIQKKDGKKKLNYCHKFTKFGWNYRCRCGGNVVWRRRGGVGGSSTDLGDVISCDVDGTGR